MDAALYSAKGTYATPLYHFGLSTASKRLASLIKPSTNFRGSFARRAVATLRVRVVSLIKCATLALMSAG